MYVHFSKATKNEKKTKTKYIRNMIVKANEKIFNKYCRHHYQIFSFIKSYLLILIENLQKKNKNNI